MLDIIILICCTLIGFALGKLFEKKICAKGRFYQDLTAYIVLLRDNVVGRQLELSSFNESFVQNCGEAFGVYLLKSELQVRLDKAKRKNLEAFFNGMDCISSSALIEHINYYGKVFSEDAKSAREDAAKSSIYPKIGMLLGAILGILFV